MFPIGIPVCLLFLLYRAKVPQMARYKRDTAWIRSIIERSVVLGMPPPPGIDLETLVVEDLPLDYIRTLHALFLATSVSEAVADAVAEARRSQTALEPHMESANVLLPEHAFAAHERSALGLSFAANPPEHVADAPDGKVMGVARGASTRLRVDDAMRSNLRVPPSSPLAVLVSVARRLWIATAEVLSRLAAARGASSGATKASAGVFFLDERTLLIKQMLHWAKHSHSTHVYEPRESQMRWRTHEDWKHFLAKVRPGDVMRPFDQAELSAFQTVAFLFSDYSHHAWYWEVVDAIEKLFLTSLIAFIVPRTVVQIVAALLFSFAMLLITMHVRPYKRESVNHLAVLSRVNIVLFLLTGLLLDINPLGFSDNHVASSVIIGGLMTSTAGMSFLMFLHSVLRDWVQQMYVQQISEDSDDDNDRDEDEDDAFADQEEAQGGEGTLDTTPAVHTEHSSAATNAAYDDEREAVHGGDAAPPAAPGIPAFPASKIPPLHSVELD